MNESRKAELTHFIYFNHLEIDNLGVIGAFEADSLPLETAEEVAYAEGVVADGSIWKPIPKVKFVNCYECGPNQINSCNC